MIFDYYPEEVSWLDLLKDEVFCEIYEAYLIAHPEGGSLHIVISDDNVEDENIEHCYNYAEENCDVAGMWLAKKLYSVKYEDRTKYWFSMLVV